MSTAPIKRALRAARSAWRAALAATGRPAPTPPQTWVPERPAPQRAPRRNVQVRVEETPNPNARKLIADVPVHAGPSRVLQSAKDAASIPVARALFGVPGVASVFIVRDFVTVTREPSAAWNELLPRATQAVKDALAEA